MPPPEPTVRRVARQPRGRTINALRRLAAAGVLAALAAGCTRGTSDNQPPARDAIPALPPASGSPADQAAQGRHPLGVKWDWSLVDLSASYLRQLAGGTTFYELVWCDVERKEGERDWNRPDRVVRDTRQLGFTLQLKIRVGSCWATGGRGQHVRGVKEKTESLPPHDMGRYEGFVRDVVRRYARMGVHEYAVENEINSPIMWGGTPDQYIQLARVAAAAIRDEDPRGVVVDPGISSTAYGWAMAKRLLDQGRADEAVRVYDAYYERRFSTRGRELPRVNNAGGLRIALRGEQAQRNLGYLGVVRRLAGERVFDIYQLHFYEKWSNVPALVDYLHSLVPRGMPIEAWEVGMFWPEGGPDERMRAQELTKTVTALLAGGVREVIWLPLMQDDADREKRYGLLDPQGKLREAGRALLRMAEGKRRQR
jgi:hypothetical protein